MYFQICKKQTNPTPNPMYKNQAKLSPVSWINIVLILNLPEIIVVITPTLSSFGALLSSFIRANTIGRDIVRPFIAAIFRGPIFSFTVVS